MPKVANKNQNYENVQTCLNKKCGVGGHGHSMCNKLLRSLFEYGPDAMFIGRMDGKIVDCNEMAEKMLGYTKEELLKMNASAFAPENNKREIWNDLIKKLSVHKTTILEGHNIRKDKTIFAVEARFRLIKYDSETLIF